MAEEPKKKKVGARSALREHFLAHVGQVLEGEDLRLVAGNITEWARRIRELRDEEGYQIQTHNDNSDLRSGQYVLISAAPNPPNVRKISKETRALVLERDGYTCQTCGAEAGQPHPYDPTKKTRLHIGHILDKSKGGTDDPSNLRTQCSVCNEGIANIAQIRPDAIELLARIRRAKAADQQEVMKFLVLKFQKEARALLP